MSNLLKNYLIQAFSNACKLPELENNSVQLLTSLGIVSGTVASKKGSIDHSSAVLGYLTAKHTDDFKKDTNCGDELCDFILLNNVTIVCPAGNGSSVHIPELLLFVEDIFGITIGQANRTD